MLDLPIIVYKLIIPMVVRKWAKCKCISNINSYDYLLYDQLLSYTLFPFTHHSRRLKDDIFLFVHDKMEGSFFDHSKC